MAEAPAGGGKKQDPQAAIAKQAAITQGGAAGDAAIIARIENSIKHSAMGWLQGQMAEVNGRAAQEQGEVHGKIEEHKNLVSTNASSKEAQDEKAGPPPPMGAPAHPAVPHPASAGAAHGPTSPHPATGGQAAAHHPAPSSSAPKAAAAHAAEPAHAPTIAAVISQAGGSDSQLDGLLNAYSPKSQQPPQMLGRVKQMGDIAQGFNGQLDVYVAQGGTVERGIAATANFFGMGKDVSAVWANNPYRKVHGILGGIMTGLSAVKNVCGVVGSICGKLGMVLTVIGLLGMIFPPIGAAVSGIARILNVVGVICDAISFVLSGVLTGLNGVVLAQQIAAGASAEEKAATADLMMSEANEAASGFVNMAMIFGPKFMKGLLGNSKGILASLMRRAKATIGRVSLKLTADIKHFANRICRRLGFGGSAMSRVGGAWKDTGFFARTKESIAESKIGKAFTSAPQHLENIQEKLMAKYGNTGWAKKLDRVGAWSGSVAQKFDLEEKVGKLGEKSGKWVGNLGAETKFGKSMAAAAERSEAQTRELAMKMEARNAADLEKSRWHNYLDKRQSQNPDHIRDEKVEKKFIHEQGEKVKQEHLERFQHDEQQREAKERLEQLRTTRFERRNDEYYHNETNGITGEKSRDTTMNSLHNSRQNRYDLEGQLHAQEEERKALLGKTTRSAEEETRLGALNTELRPLDDARRLNRMYETDLQGLASGAERPRAPEYRNWKDVGENVMNAGVPVLEMVHLKNQDAAWAAAEKSSLKKQAKYSKGSAQGNAAGRGGHGTFEEIENERRHAEMADFSNFVRGNQTTTPVVGTVRSMLSGVYSRASQQQQTPAPAQQSVAPAVAPTTAPHGVQLPPSLSSPAQHAHEPQGGVSVAPTQEPTQATPGHDHGGAVATTATIAATVHNEPQQPAQPQAQAPQQQAGGEGGQADEGAGETLPYWPSLLPEFDKATHDFGWMRKVGVEFKKAQIEGKQKAVDTLAVYGRYQEYAKLRAAAAQQNQTASANTGKSIQQNVDHAGQTQAQAGQGENKQNEAKGAANDRAATDLPEPESRGFWGRILGAVKRWAKNKAAQVFGWIQEKIASVILKGLCGVSMGDMREYAGALRRQQQSAHGVADNAGKQSAQTHQTSIKLGSDATKEAQGAADAIGECDKNITDADNFMTDITSFESQLVEEKAHAQSFLAQVHAATHAEQAKQQAAAAQHAADEQKQQQQAAQLGGGQDHATPTPTPTPTPGPAPAQQTGPQDQTAQQQNGQQPAAAGAQQGQDNHEQTDTSAQDQVEIHSASNYVAGQAESMTSQLDAKSEDYQNQLALALTNHTGKDQSGVDLKGPAKKESKHIVEEFKEFATQTKKDMDGFSNMSIDPSQTKAIADQIIQSAEHLEQNFGHSQTALAELFERTYTGIREGRRTLKSQILDGDNVIGNINHAGDQLDNKVIDTALPQMNQAWNTVSQPIQTPAAPAPAPQVAPDAMQGGVQVADQPGATPNRAPA